MRLVIQRVKEASCIIDGAVYSQIQKGYVIFLGFTHTDTKEIVQKAARKVVKLRIFSDENNKMNQSIEDVVGEIMVISQFTLYGDASQGNRPSFTMSMSPQDAKQLYEEFYHALQKLFSNVKTGQFQEHMDISLVNDGPVTILLDF